MTDDHPTHQPPDETIQFVITFGHWKALNHSEAYCSLASEPESVLQHSNIDPLILQGMLYGVVGACEKIARTAFGLDKLGVRQDEHPAYSRPPRTDA